MLEPARKAGLGTHDGIPTAQLVMDYLASDKASDSGQFTPANLATLLLAGPFIEGRALIAHEGLQKMALALEGGWNHPRMMSIAQSLLGNIISRVKNADDASAVLQRFLNHPHLRTLLQKPESALGHYALGRACLYQHASMSPQSWMRLLLEVGARPLSGVHYSNGENLLQKACKDVAVSPNVLKMSDIEQQHPVLSALADHGLADWLAVNKKGLVARQLLPTALEEAAKPAELRARQRHLDSQLPTPAPTQGTSPRF